MGHALFAEVQVTVQTDAVSGIPCGTSGGVMINFDKVEVVNRLNVTHVYETIKNYTVNYDKCVLCLLFAVCLLACLLLLLLLLLLPQHIQDA